MPGPIGEKCSDCYWWDIDRKKKQRNNVNKKYHWYADCCFGDPGSKYEIASMREDLFCSEYVNREYGIEEYGNVGAEEEEEYEEEIEIYDAEVGVNLLESVVDLLNNDEEEDDDNGEGDESSKKDSE